MQFSIEDSAKTVAFLRDAIGFNARPTGALGTNPVVANLIGLPGAQWRITHGSIPGTTLDFGLIEYSGVPRAKVVAGAEDPGSPAFTMIVRDINAAVDQWTKAGGSVATTGGKADRAGERRGQCVRPRRQRLDVGVNSAGRSVTVAARYASVPSRDSYGVVMGLRPTHGDESANVRCRRINGLWRAFNRAVD